MNNGINNGKINNETNNDLNNKLLEISGIGNKLAKELIDKGVKSINDLINNKEIFDVLSLETQQHLLYKPTRNNPYHIVELIEKELKTVLASYKMVMAGSYRRQLRTVNDLDVLVMDKSSQLSKKRISQKRNSKKRNSKKDGSDIISNIDNLENEKALSFMQMILDKINSTRLKTLTPYSFGKDKVSVLVKYNTLIEKQTPMYIKMDIFRTIPKTYPFMLLYTTGSQMHNIKMRAVAKRHGMLLNQNGLWKVTIKNGKETRRSLCLDCKTEKNIFDKLSITYLEPSNR